MIGIYTQGRTAVFIDAANVFYSQRSMGWRIDYRKLITYLRAESDFAGAYYYTGIVGSHERQRSFIGTLDSLGYRVTKKEVKFIKIGGGQDLPKGNLDVELALDAFRLKESFDTIILFSGDSDFAYLLDVLKREHKAAFINKFRNPSI